MSALDITLMSLTEIIGDFGFKAFARTGGMAAFAQGSIGYMGIIYFLIRSLRVGNVLYTNAAWDGVSAILESLVAFLLFKERLNTPIQYMGVFFIIAGLFALKSGGIPYN